MMSMAAERPGGFGAIKFDGTDDFIELSSATHGEDTIE